MSASWFWNRHGKAEGPATLDRMEGLIREGLLLKHSLVFREGGLKWEPAGNYPELAPFFRERESLASPETAGSGKNSHWVVLQKEVRPDGVFFRQKGPYAVSEVQEMMRAQVISPSDFGWTEGYDRWVRLSEVEAFAHGNFKLDSASKEHLSAVEQFAPTLDVLPPPMAIPRPAPVAVTPPKVSAPQPVLTGQPMVPPPPARSAPNIPVAPPPSAVQAQEEAELSEVTQIPLPQDDIEATVIAAPAFPVVQQAPAPVFAVPSEPMPQPAFTPRAKPTPYFRYALAATLPLVLYFFAGDVVRWLKSPGSSEPMQADFQAEPVPVSAREQSAPSQPVRAKPREASSMAEALPTPAPRLAAESARSDRPTEVPLTLATKAPGLTIHFWPQRRAVSLKMAFQPNGTYQVTFIGRTGQVVGVPSLYSRFNVTADEAGILQIPLVEKKIPNGIYQVRVNGGGASVNEQITLAADSKALRAQLNRHRKQSAYQAQQERRRVLASIDKMQGLLSESQRAKSKKQLANLRKKINSVKFSELSKIQSDRYELFYPDAWRVLAQTQKTLEELSQEGKGRAPASIKKAVTQSGKSLKSLEAKVRSFSQYR